MFYRNKRNENKCIKAFISILTDMLNNNQNTVIKYKRRKPILTVYIFLNSKSPQVF